MAEKYVPVTEKTAFTGSSWLLSERKKENGFHWPENQFPLAGMKEFVKNTFSLDENKLLLVGISEKWRKNGFL